MAQYVYAHTHPWAAGTVIGRSPLTGAPLRAAEGPSDNDINSNALMKAMGRNVMDYVVTPMGIYRVLGLENVQWIAPLDYLDSTSP